MRRPDERERVVEAALAVLSGKWRPGILLALSADGPLGFNDLESRLGDVSGKVLTENLDDLQDAGVIEREVLSESPLRVEYALTAPGRDLEAILEELTTWGERHLQRTRPCVLIADPDRRLTELYRHWLSPQYAVQDAHDGDTLQRELDESVDVVVFDRALPGVSGQPPGVLARDADDDCRVVMVTAERPDLELVDRECDDVVRKPASRDVLRSTIERQIDRKGEPPARREFHALEARRRVLEDTHSEGVLSDSAQFERLQSRIEAAAEALETNEE